MSEGLNRADLLSYAKQHKGEYEALLRQFVETPSVSVDPAHAPDIQKAADMAVETMRKFGGKTQLYHADRGNPVIHGVFGSDKNLPTVTVYNHMDVQPASKETEPWETEPFVMTQKGDTYYGRGTTDDKGPALAVFAYRDLV